MMKSPILMSIWCNYSNCDRPSSPFFCSESSFKTKIVLNFDWACVNPTLLTSSRPLRGEFTIEERWSECVLARCKVNMVLHDVVLQVYFTCYVKALCHSSWQYWSLEVGKTSSSTKTLTTRWPLETSLRSCHEGEYLLLTLMAKDNGDLSIETFSSLQKERKETEMKCILLALIDWFPTTASSQQLPKERWAATYSAFSWTLLLPQHDRDVRKSSPLLRMAYTLLRMTNSFLSYELSSLTSNQIALFLSFLQSYINKDVCAMAHLLRLVKHTRWQW